MSSLVEKIVLEPSPSYPLYTLATRHSIGPRDTYNSSDLVLICLHAVGCHKEAWDPTIDHLFNLERKSLHRHGRIREVYSIDCPNHGESAIVNAEILNTHYKDSWTTREYARAVYAFLMAGPTRGAKVDFRKRRIVVVGHCLGAVASFFMHELNPPIRLEAVIAFDPAFSPGLDYPDYREVFRKFQYWTWLRPSVWPSRKAALKDLRERPLYKTWDPAVLRSFVEHGLSDHPGSKYPEPYKFSGVVMSTTKEQEAATYRSDDFVGEPMEALRMTASKTPVHLIWGKIEDILPNHLKYTISNHTNLASVEYIEEAGHLIVQQKPRLVAEKIHDRILLLNSARAVL
ncbi:hypothetical protein GALMADRAFT_243049 [Galerina marginata CBS 339.88]|uniref:AB hydrolase-1 domain-containing protein n=1 Tax=Galerina marginata (strain CBS 339.88) TaxID=685588 RepID=A0A067T9W8_GALM3|nr:hypothetical protein GALMADRAFT_243049 [Galerina marginata CBS 339.88]